MRSLLTFLFVFIVFIPPAAAFEYLWCCNKDAVRVEVDPATSVVRIIHEAALYNCCPEPILYDVELGDATLMVTERTLEESPCDCDCCFELGVKIADVPPGPWQVGRVERRDRGA